MSADFSLLLQAITRAVVAHQGQLRKDGETPYAAHPLRVMTIARNVFRVEDVEVLAAAALHDTIEDTTVDRDNLIEEFGPRVAEYVAMLSKDMRLPEEQREAEYFQALVAAPLEVKLCKLGDVYDNLADSRKLSTAFRRKKLAQAGELVEAFEADLAQDWPHVLEAVRQQMEVIRQSLD